MTHQVKIALADDEYAIFLAEAEKVHEELEVFLFASQRKFIFKQVILVVFINYVLMMLYNLCVRFKQRSKLLLLKEWSLHLSVLTLIYSALLKLKG